MTRSMDSRLRHCVERPSTLSLIHVTSPPAHITSRPTHDSPRSGPLFPSPLSASTRNPTSQQSGHPAHLSLPPPTAQEPRDGPKMCGRFALGLGASELRDQLAREYFREPADDVDGPRREPRARDGREPDDDDNDDGGNGDDRVEGEEQHKESRDSMPDSQRQQERRRLEWEVATGAGTGHEDRTSESTWKPRYNVAPKSGGVVVRRRSKGSSFELSVLRWGLV